MGYRSVFYRSCGSLNRVPAFFRDKGGKVTSGGWQVTLRDVSSCIASCKLLYAVDFTCVYFQGVVAQQQRQRQPRRSSARVPVAGTADHPDPALPVHRTHHPRRDHPHPTQTLSLCRSPGAYRRRTDCDRALRHKSSCRAITFCPPTAVDTNCRN